MVMKIKFTIDGKVFRANIAEDVTSTLKNNKEKIDILLELDD